MYRRNPPLRKNWGRRRITDVSLLDFFWGEGDVCTQTIRLKFKREQVNASSQVLNSLSSTSLNSFQRELFTCLFQRLLRLNRMAKFYPPNWIWKNHLRQHLTKGNRLGLEKTWIPARPSGRQLSPLTFPGSLLACLRLRDVLRDVSDEGAQIKKLAWPMAERQIGYRKS